MAKQQSVNSFIPHQISEMCSTPINTRDTTPSKCLILVQLIKVKSLFAIPPPMTFKNDAMIKRTELHQVSPCKQLAHSYLIILEILDVLKILQRYLKHKPFLGPLIVIRHFNTVQKYTSHSIVGMAWLGSNIDIFSVIFAREDFNSIQKILIIIRSFMVVK